MDKESEETKSTPREKAHHLLDLIDTYFEAKRGKIFSQMMLTLVPGNDEVREYVKKMETEVIPGIRMSIHQEFKKLYEAAEKVSNEK